MDISIVGQGEKHITKVNITDQNHHVVFNSTTSGNNEIISTPALNIEKGRFYFVTAVSVSGETLTNVIYSTEHILENVPNNCWFGVSYMGNYEEYLNIFERAYKVLIELTRNSQDIATKGVTINRLPWPAATGGFGVCEYGIDTALEGPLIKDKQYLPNSPIAAGQLDTRFHELAHAVLAETLGSSLVTQEGIACFFEAELLRLLDYDKGYLAKVDMIVHSFRECVGDKYNTIASQFSKAASHTDMGAWIVAYLLQDFVGYGEFESEIDNPVNLAPDFGWDFLKNYFLYASEIEVPSAYNNDEKLLYYFELASNLSLKQDFKNWGFNIRDTYGTAPFYEYLFYFSMGSKAYAVTIVTNSTLSRVNFNQSQLQISFRVTGALGTTGFSNVTVQKEMLEMPYSITVNGGLPTVSIESSNNTHASLFFTYNHPEKNVQITGHSVSPSPSLPSNNSSSPSPSLPSSTFSSIFSTPTSIFPIIGVSSVLVALVASVLLRKHLKRKKQLI